MFQMSGFGMTELTGASHICPATGSDKQGSVGPMLPNQESKVRPYCVKRAS